MTRLLPLACILLLTLGWQQENVEANPIMAAKEVVEFVVFLSETKDKIKQILDGPPSEDEQLTQVNVKLTSQLQTISDKIKILKKELFGKLGELKTKFSARLSEIYAVVRTINSDYETFLDYVKNLKDVRNSSLTDFANIKTSTSYSELPTVALTMHYKLADDDGDDKSIFNTLADSKNMEIMCSHNLGLPQLMNDMYELVISTHIKGMAMQLFSYSVKESFESKPFTVERNSALKKFTNRVTETYAKLKVALASVSRELWKCDPAVHNKGTTYSNLQEIFQKYINFEGDFLFDEYACKGNCASHSVSSQTCNSPFCKNTPEEKRCKGTLRDCETINQNMTLCKASANSTRRYEWLETASGTKYGHYQHCNLTTQPLIKENAPLLYKCEYCVCTCESRKKDINRYISLKKAVSDTYKNYVVTGARFKVLNNVFYLQVQQAVLGQNGSLIGTTRWKKITEIKKGKLANEAYHIDWAHRTVHLDDIEPEPRKEDLLKDRAVVGLQFEQDGHGVHLSVRTMAFNYTTGELDLNSARWENRMSSPSSRAPLSLEGSDDPVLENNHLPNSRPGHYVQFQTTDLGRDLGQNTIPFIDIQDVTSNKAVPLAGAGIFHKGSEDSGGFLALKVIQYDYSKHL